MGGWEVDGTLPLFAMGDRELPLLEAFAGVFSRWVVMGGRGGVAVVGGAARWGIVAEATVVEAT